VVSRDHLFREDLRVKTPSNVRNFGLVGMVNLESYMNFGDYNLIVTKSPGLIIKPSQKIKFTSFEEF